MRATFSRSGGSSWRLYNHSRAAPLVSCAPTTEPADVPTTRSALLRSTPASASPARTPISQAMPVIPPPPRTRAVRWSLIRTSSQSRVLYTACDPGHARCHGPRCLPREEDAHDRHAVRPGADRCQLATRAAPVPGLSGGPGRVDPARGGASLEEPDGVHRPRRTAELRGHGTPRSRG